MRGLILAATRSWKTTLAGVIPGVIILLEQIRHFVDGDSGTMVDVEQIGVAIGLIWLAIVARDNSVRSERAGAK